MSMQAPRAESSRGSRNGGVAAARILVIDDEPRIVNFVARGLRAQGYAVDTAVESAEGLRVAAADG